LNDRWQGRPSGRPFHFYDEYVAISSNSKMISYHPTTNVPYRAPTLIGDAMPAQVVVVLDDLSFANQVVEELSAESYEAVAMPGPLAALDALESVVRMEVLITCPIHAEGQPNGVSLALMARAKRRDVKVIFVGTREQAQHTEGLGTFLTSPVTVEVVVETAVRLLTAGTL
jgi:PleD family two-component response regulator